MLQSALDTAASPDLIEAVFYQDEDDDTLLPPPSRILRGPRITLSQCWNECAASAAGDLLMMMADDAIFQTPGWDRMIEGAFAATPDRILMVHGDDLRTQGNRRDFGVFPTIHRRWYNEVGCFVPGVFVGDKPDDWLNDIANALGRRRFLPYVTDHRHPYWGKAEPDDTYRERWERERQDDPIARYATLAPERDRAIERLRSLLGTPYVQSI